MGVAAGNLENGFMLYLTSWFGVACQNAWAEQRFQLRSRYDATYRLPSKCNNKAKRSCGGCAFMCFVWPPFIGGQNRALCANSAKVNTPEFYELNKLRIVGDFAFKIDDIR